VRGGNIWKKKKKKKASPNPLCAVSVLASKTGKQEMSKAVVVNRRFTKMHDNWSSCAAVREKTKLRSKHSSEY